MIEISILDYKHNEMPNIVARGESEEQAVDIFVILYNAHMLTSGGRFPLTNVGENFVCTTYIVGMTHFHPLFDYMKDVHGVNLDIVEKD